MAELRRGRCFFVIVSGQNHHNIQGLGSGRSATLDGRFRQFRQRDAPWGDSLNGTLGQLFFQGCLILITENRS